MVEKKSALVKLLLGKNNKSMDSHRSILAYNLLHDFHSGSFYKAVPMKF